MGQHPPLALVVGAGAGLGQSLLSRLQRGGFHVVGLGRTRPDKVVGEFHSIDLADEVAVPTLIETIIADYGPPKIVIHNTAELIIAPFATTKLADYQRTWISQVQTAVLLAQATLQPMVLKDGGTFFFGGDRIFAQVCMFATSFLMELLTPFGLARCMPLTLIR